MSDKPWPSFQKPSFDEERRLLLEKPSEQEELESDWATVKGEVPPELKDGIPVMSDESLREFVFGWCDGQVFTSNHISPSYKGDNSIITMVFLPLALGALKDMSEESVKHIGIIWEWRDQAGPTSINGYPVFFSLRFMHKDDWARASLAITNELDRRKNVKI